MKKSPVIAVIIILLAAAGLWFFVFRDKQKTATDQETALLNVSRHSDGLNRSLQNMMDAYYKLTEGFVNWDTTTVAKYSTELKTALDSLQMDELKKDSLIYPKAIAGIANAKSEMEGIIRDPSLDEKRGSLNILSQQMFDFLATIRYDAAKVYFQECPMAFDDIHSGYWLSSSDAVRNPYLGTKHPKYKSGMLKCGAPKDTLNFMR